MNPANFNVTLIRPPGYVHSLALSEAAEYVHSQLLDCGYQSRLSSNDFDPNAINVLFCAHLLEVRHVRLLPARVIIFNSEQLSNRQGWYFQSGVYGQLLTQHWVWDYSLSHLACLPHQRSAHIPFLYSSRLRRPDMARRTDGNLLFYGSITPHRERIFSELRALGIAVDVLFGVYGRERDERMFAARAVLNLHNADSVDVFEPIRCFYPLINGIPVLSEATNNDETVTHFRNAMFFLPKQDFSSSVERLLGNAAEFDQQADAFAHAFTKTASLKHVSDAAQRYLANAK